MPKTAQDRTGRAPLAALLILLSLFLAGGTAAAGSSSQAPDARLGAGRHAAPTALLPAPNRTHPDDEVPRSGTGPFALPSAPAPVTQSLWTRPSAGFPTGVPAAAPRAPSSPYRSRAPPAS